ncbi:MAG: class I SAM-dependent methyltransferase [Candidatus Diapherotrites archaeon]|nr:class I SAM-dependent methyltransferase [Candidatus Diapherotrites archaeon]
MMQGSSYRERELELIRLKLVMRLRIKKGDEVLEIGSGKGGTSLLIAAATHAKVTGVEPDKEFLRISRKWAKDLGINAAFKPMPFDGTISLKDKYDFVILSAVLHHTEERTGLRIVSEAVRLTKKGGCIGILEHRKVSKSRVHKSQWSVAKLRKSLGKSSAKVISTESAGKNSFIIVAKVME